METKNTKAFGTSVPNADLQKMTIPLRTVTPTDVEIEVLYYGCHSDLYFACNG